MWIFDRSVDVEHYVVDLCCRVALLLEDVVKVFGRGVALEAKFSDDAVEGCGKIQEK